MHIYKPTYPLHRRDLWEELDLVISRWEGPWCIKIDVKSYLVSNERIEGCCRQELCTTSWFGLTVMLCLFDFRLAGAQFTWLSH